MTHQVSPLGIVGLGALGRAVETFLVHEKHKKPSAVLFAVKAFDLEASLLEQADQWPAEVPFVTLANGYIFPILEESKHVLSPRSIRVGMTTIGSTIGEDGSLTIYSEKSVTAWGPLDSTSPPPSPEELDRLRLFPSGQWHDDMRPLLRQKWIFNVVINSLSAVHRLSHNGALENFRSETEAVLSEALELANILWKDVPWELALSAEDKILQRLWAVVAATSGNENSMARDARLKKPTESRFLAGIARDYDGFEKLKRLHRQITDL